MKLYYPIGILKKAHETFGDLMFTYDSQTRWEEVEDCFRCWILDYGMQFKRLLVEVHDTDFDENDPDHLQIYELEPHLTCTMGKRLKDRREGL